MQPNEIPLASPVWQCGDESEWERCLTCNSIGHIRIRQLHGQRVILEKLLKCPECKGTGRRRYWGRDD